VIRYISDLHFGASGILAYNRRDDNLWADNGYTLNHRADGITTSEQWDTFLTENWNTCVCDSDITYILGDTCMSGVQHASACIRSLRGNKILIAGNHDKRFLQNPEFRSCFLEIYDTWYETIIPRTSLEKWNHNNDFLYLDEGIYNEDLPVILSHYPIFAFNKNCYGAIMLYGHIHSAYYENTLLETACSEYTKYRKFPMNMFNTGCMMPYMDYMPKTIEEIIKGHKAFYQR